jgi:hypothetical protein
LCKNQKADKLTTGQPDKNTNTWMSDQEESLNDFFSKDDVLRSFVHPDFSSKDFIHSKLRTGGSKKAENQHDSDIQKLNSGVDRLQTDLDANVRTIH